MIQEPPGTTGLIPVELPKEGHYRDLVPCQRACPVHTDARGYVRAIAEGRFEEAYLIARGPNPFASICGRICGAPCEAACRRGLLPRTDLRSNSMTFDRPVSIRALKRFACERWGVEARDPGQVLTDLREFLPPVLGDVEEMAALLRERIAGGFLPASGETIAIIGGGPAGLSAAHDLALMGFCPHVYEMETVPGGMLGTGVPEYRLPRDLIRREISVIEALGAELHYGMRVGRDIQFADLRRDHRAIVIAAGAKRSRSLNLPGEVGPGVYGGVDVLRSVAVGRPLPLGSEVLVIGGGNVAYDVARTVVRQAAYDTARTVARLAQTRRVGLVSLETLEEMPADTVEIQEGDEEGVDRYNGWGPVEIRRDSAGAVESVAFQRCFRVYDEHRRFAPQFDSEQRLTLPCDTVLLAVGQATDLSFLVPGGEDIEQIRPGWPRCDPETLQTTAEDVFVAGDLAHGTRLLIDAVASGKKAARSVYEFVTGRRITSESMDIHLVEPRYSREAGYEGIPRQEIPTLSARERLRSPASQVEVGFSEFQARLEASRCLDCGVTPVFDGKRCVLCGGCADVCPTRCLKLVSLEDILPDPLLAGFIRSELGEAPDLSANSAILKDEDRCIRCALCAMRCPVDAITMERLTFDTKWRSGS